MPTAGITLALSDYLTQTQRLLKDTGLLYNQTDLTEFINRAIRQRDLDFRMNRLKMTFTLTASQSTYTYAAVTSGGTVVIGSTNAVVMDVRSIVVMPMGVNTIPRYPLGRRAYTDPLLTVLLSTSYPSYPIVYAIYGPTTVVLAPPPALAYASEFDFIAYSADLVNPTDQDNLPYPYTDPVPFLAAGFAKLNSQRFDEAQQLGALYAERANRVNIASRAIQIKNPLSNLPAR